MLLSSTHPQSVAGCPFQLSSQLPWISYPPSLLGEGEAALCKHHGAVSGDHGKRCGASGIGVGWGSLLSGPWGCLANGRSWSCPLPGTDHELGPWRLVLAMAHWEFFDRRRDCSGKM